MNIRPRHILCSLSDMTGAEDFFLELLDVLPEVVVYATEGTARRVNALLSPAESDTSKHDGSAVRTAGHRTDVPYQHSPIQDPPPSVVQHTDAPYQHSHAQSHHVQSSTVQHTDAPYQHPRIISIYDYTAPPRGTLDVVKTLDSRIFVGILADRESEEHRATVAAQNIILFDMVIVNFYAEKIDIGGPALIRAAAKNARYVTAICTPAQYTPCIAHLRAHAGATKYAFRRECALTSLHAVAEYVRGSTRHVRENL